MRVPRLLFANAAVAASVACVTAAIPERDGRVLNKSCPALLGSKFPFSEMTTIYKGEANVQKKKDALRLLSVLDSEYTVALATPDQVKQIVNLCPKKAAAGALCEIEVTKLVAPKYTDKTAKGRVLPINIMVGSKEVIDVGSRSVAAYDCWAEHLTVDLKGLDGTKFGVRIVVEDSDTAAVAKKGSKKAGHKVSLVFSSPNDPTQREHYLPVHEVVKISSSADFTSDNMKEGGVAILVAANLEDFRKVPELSGPLTDPSFISVDANSLSGETGEEYHREFASDDKYAMIAGRAYVDHRQVVYIGPKEIEPFLFLKHGTASKSHKSIKRSDGAIESKLISKVLWPLFASFAGKGGKSGPGLVVEETNPWVTEGWVKFGDVLSVTDPTGSKSVDVQVVTHKGWPGARSSVFLTNSDRRVAQLGQNSALHGIVYDASVFPHVLPSDAGAQRDKALGYDLWASCLEAVDKKKAAGINVYGHATYPLNARFRQLVRSSIHRLVKRVVNEKGGRPKMDDFKPGGITNVHISEAARSTPLINSVFKVAKGDLYSNEAVSKADQEKGLAKCAHCPEAKVLHLITKVVPDPTENRFAYLLDGREMIGNDSQPRPIVNIDKLVPSADGSKLPTEKEYIAKAIADRAHR